MLTRMSGCRRVKKRAKVLVRDKNVYSIDIHVSTVQRCCPCEVTNVQYKWLSCSKCVLLFHACLCHCLSLSYIEWLEMGPSCFLVPFHASSPKPCLILWKHLISLAVSIIRCYTVFPLKHCRKSSPGAQAKLVV